MVFTRIAEVVKNRVHDGVELFLNRRNRRGRVYTQEKVRLGPNMVHVFITHVDGSITDLGCSYNLLTNIGRDVWSSWIGAFIPAAQNAPATAVSTSAVTGTGTTWTASNLATPQLGISTFRMYAPVTGLTTAPVYANVISNTTSVATIDQWWNAADGTGTTPAATNSFILAPGGIGSVRFMALTTDSGAASASDTVLATENTANGVARALATYAHTFGASTLTLQKQWTASGTITALQKMGLFCSLTQGGTTAAAGGPVILETTFTTATLVNGDQITVTDSITLSG